MSCLPWRECRIDPPLDLNEKYEFQLEPNTGLEIKFLINEETGDLETED